MFGLLATITLEVAPFHVYALLPALLTFFKCVPPQLCQNGDVSVFCSMGETEKSQGGQVRRVGGGGVTVILFLVKNSLGKGNMSWCVVVMQQPVLLSPKFEAKSSHIFMQSL
jgi:hypothetical protein